MSLLPLFPLPNVVLFPGALLPLHIFEPRYRAMVGDALGGDRRIGVILLRDGWQVDYDGRPPIHSIGCSGVIEHATQLDDGRYNIVLRGLSRFRVVAEDTAQTYRRATAMPLADPPLDDAARRALQHLRRTLETRLGLTSPAEVGASTRLKQLSHAPDVEFVHILAHHLDFDPIEKQALLERDTLLQRAGALLALLDMKRMSASTPHHRDLSH